MAQLATYPLNQVSLDKGVLVSNLSSMLKVGAEDAIAKAKSIADSYASLIGINKGEEEAASMIMKHFGVNNPQVLDTIFMYVNKFEGSIAKDYTKL